MNSLPTARSDCNLKSSQISGARCSARGPSAATGKKSNLAESPELPRRVTPVAMVTRLDQTKGMC